VDALDKAGDLGGEERMATKGSSCGPPCAGGALGGERGEDVVGDVFTEICLLDETSADELGVVCYCFSLNRVARVLLRK
jgi:hypothetical protein